LKDSDLHNHTVLSGEFVEDGFQPREEGEGSKNLIQNETFVSKEIGVMESSSTVLG